MIYEVYDIETLSNLFTYTGFNCNTKEFVQFVICSWQDDTSKLINHLKTKDLVQIGFNNNGFDYPVIHHILNYSDEYKSMSGYEIASDIYKKSQEIISMEFSTIADKNQYIPQIDLFKIWHFDNKARITSLKDLEISMRMENVEEMPIHHSTHCKQGDEKLILEYNKNDVEATYKFFLTTLGRTEYPLYKGKNKLELRNSLKKRFGIPCLNWPDVKIGEQLILKLYCDKTNNTVYKLKQFGTTSRSEIKLSECIPNWANFESKEFQQLKTKFQNTVIKNIKGEFHDSVIYHGIKIDYGTGGAHSSAKPGIYESDDKWIILDEDIGFA